MTLVLENVEVDTSDLDAPRCEAIHHKGPHNEPLTCGIVAVAGCYVECCDSRGIICQPLVDSLVHTLIADPANDPHRCLICRRLIRECWSLLPM